MDKRIEIPITLAVEARGRNGWFKPHLMTVSDSNGGGVKLTVESSHGFVNVAPIFLRLTRNDAEALIDALWKQLYFTEKPHA